MAYLVNRQEQILVRRGAHNVCRQEELPRQERRISKEVGTESLEGDDEEDDIFREGLRPAQLRYLEGGQNN
jgi:hypothetical protein